MSRSPGRHEYRAGHQRGSLAAVAGKKRPDGSSRTRSPAHRTPVLANRFAVALTSGIFALALTGAGSYLVVARQSGGSARTPVASQAAQAYAVSLAADARSEARHAAAPVVLAAVGAGTPGATSFEPVPGLTISISGNTVTVDISRSLSEEIESGLEAGESVAELVESILDDVPDNEGSAAGAGITAAALGLAAAAWGEVSAFCTSQAADSVEFQAGPTILACGDFRITI